MFPIYDENPTRETPYVTYVLIGLNIVVFLHEISLSTSLFVLDGRAIEEFFQLYAVIPRQLSSEFFELTSYQAIPEWVTLFSSQFLHGGWWHLISNMVFLWVFGNNIEDRLGKIKYLFFYLSCGALAALCQYVINIGSAIPSLGASGAIAGVLGAYLIRFPRAEVNTLILLGFIFTVRLPAFIPIGFFFIQNVIAGVYSLQAAANMTGEMGGVAYWAHIGGFVFGIILSPILGLFSREY
ncbi:MAG: rhomboid family intramembrane serine protease [Cyanobacteria bacterium P01_A01_bin.84]